MINILINFKIKLIKLYKFICSPLLGNNCRYFTPCSEYYIQSLKIHGLFKGTFMGIKRILSCHPFKSLGGGSDFDFVPDKNQINRESKNG